LQQQLTQAAWELDALVARGGEELLGEEGVAFRAGDDRVGQRRRRCAGPSREERRQLLARERTELDQERRARTPHAVGEPTHALGRRRLIPAVGREQQHAPLVEIVREVHDEVERRRVSPVQVLEHDQHRCIRREVREEGERVLEDAQLGAGRLALGVPIPMRAQRLDERLVRQLGTDEIEAAPQEDLESRGASTCRELRREARLADPCLAGDQHRRSATGVRPPQRALETPQLLGAPDQRERPRRAGEVAWCGRVTPAGVGLDDCQQAP
jgi:hypothetical protein